MENFEVKYKTNFFSKQKTVVFSENALSLYSGNKLLLQIDQEQICNVRYGVDWISGYRFYIGRIYRIDVSDGRRKTIKVRLRSLYGINKGKLEDKYVTIVDKLYDFYFKDKILNYIGRINSGEDVAMAGIVFKKDGIVLNSKRASRFIAWEDLNSRSYYDYHTLSSKKQPDFYNAFTYLKDWNATLVFSISRGILQEKGLLEE
jgi:hypothetical protein